MEFKDTEVYCICGQPYDNERFMIQCDACKEWFHGSCVGVWEYMSLDLDKYHCPKCEPFHGPSQLKKQYNWHRHNYSDMNADSKAVETGTPVFIKELKSRHFHSSDAVVLKLNGHELTMQYLLQIGFEQPIMIEKNEGLGLVVPPSTITLREIEASVGSDRQIDVIDVYRQTDISMKFGEFVNYFLDENRYRVLNLLSMEISDTSLSEIVEPPAIARSLDWANSMWPETYDLEDEEYCMKKPAVQKYCLIGAQDSYTDFHIDFGGTSVWYHILQGEKIFYLIKPTPSNLALYQRWMTSSTQYETFFADQVDYCYKCTIRAGNTLFIPTGWIHAVLTPVDSLVFGGNFVHSMSIPMQLKIYELEKKIDTPEKFRFPGFETINWYAARQICKELKVINKNVTQVPKYLLTGVKALLVALKQWSQDKNANKNKREHIPMLVEAPKLLKELSKEIRNAERFLNTLNPPKPERESKRKRRKPLNKDFVDYSQRPMEEVMEEEEVKPEVKEHLKLSIKVKSEVKEPLKLSIKVLNKKFEVNQEENQIQGLLSSQQIDASHIRPPLKLTLPKPATYPYSTPLDPLSNIEENKNWSVMTKTEPNDFIVDNQGDLKMKIEKLKLPLRPLDSGMNEKRTGTTNSIYDFHDDSEDIDEDEDCLTIDENPAKKLTLSSNIKMTPSPATKKPTSFRSKKFQFQLGTVLASYKGQDGSEVDVVSDSPKNGIEELLKASCYANPNPQTDHQQTGRTSPSTREAIAGMLSIGQGPSFIADAGETERSRSKRKARANASSHEEEIDETIHKVHQDDDFIYPSLDLSDEDDFLTTSKGKGDEAWSPRAKVGQIIPKRDRPSREGVRKQAVEKGLEAAAKRTPLSTSTSTSTSTPAVISAPPSRIKKIAKKNSRKKQKPKRPTTDTCTPVPVPVPNMPSTSTAPPFSSSSAPFSPRTDKGRKPKKGMATAKQRLGKILKIHKMMH